APLAAANEAGHMDCAEYLARMPHPAKTSTLVAPPPDSATMHKPASMRKCPGPALVTEPDPVDSPTSRDTIGTPDLDDEVDADNDVRIMQPLRLKYDTCRLEIVERKIYKALRESDMHDVKVTLAVYN